MNSSTVGAADRSRDSFTIASQLVDSIGSHRKAAKDNLAPQQLLNLSSPPYTPSRAAFELGDRGLHLDGPQGFLEPFQVLHSKFLEDVLALYKQGILAEIGKEGTYDALSAVSVRPQPRSELPENDAADLKGISIYPGMTHGNQQEEPNTLVKMTNGRQQGEPKNVLQRSKSKLSSMQQEYLPFLIAKLHGREFLVTPLEKFVVSPIYNVIVTTAVFAQAAIAGIDVQLEMKYQEHRLSGEVANEVPVVLDWIAGILSGFFVIELVFRIGILRNRFFFANNMDNRYWNWFDLVVVLACIPDYVPHSSVLDFAFIRVLRLLRVVRVLRAAHTVPTLRKMIFALLHSMSSLLPLVILLFLLLYMFALVFMQGAIADLKEMEYVPDNTTVRLLAAKQFGDQAIVGCVASAAGLGHALGVHHPFRDLGASMESLFTIVTGDGDYYKILKPIMETNALYKIWGLFFSVFFFFGFMNVATGLFVDKAMQIATQDRDMVLQDAMQRQEDDTTAMKQLFRTADLDGDGSLTVDELRTVVCHPDVKSWLASIDLDFVDDFDAVVQLLDPNGTGSIEADVFYQYIGRFRGPARRLETSLGLMESRAVAAELRELLNSLHQKVK